MGVGRVVGYALLGLVDAFVPSAIAAALAFEIGYYVPSYPRVTAALAVAGVGLAVGVVLGSVAAMRGGKPFTLTRGAVAIWDRYFWYV
ncbi:hypothetical protein BV210_04640 [Halorientalis sp. IM1011]|uniref:hypothetical protein n=1 Tax=Halorientalis sp. IM1011 TaxID=1932360 RepID=UPI00097CCFAA|nr:hypothetical protein [Halorientalis sp. IM1011]AQL42046.1 hypothetical protein BV210_04640 [Halorientalis sp. IM1011]